MKNALLILVIGVIVGAVAVHLYHNPPATTAQTPPAETTPSPSPAATAEPSLIDRARESASSAKDALADKFAEWHLTPDEVKEDLAKTGQVVRTKARATGETLATATSNTRIVAVIKAKYTLDKELSARAIDVDCDAGKVTLSGTVASTPLIAKAIALALETDGVTDVTSKLTVQP